jgi:hypothetical protein
MMMTYQAAATVESYGLKFAALHDTPEISSSTLSAQWPSVPGPLTGEGPHSLYGSSCDCSKTAVSIFYTWQVKLAE